MQHGQMRQSKSVSPDRKVRFPLRHTVLPMSFNAAAQGKPLRRNPVRLLRPVNMLLPEVVDIPSAAFEKGSAGQRGKPGFGTICEAQDEAARRIAHRLHDETAQMLATVYLGLADIAHDCPHSTVQKIDHVVKQLDEVCVQLRSLSHELHPRILEQLGLMPALQSLADGIRKRSGLRLVVSGSIPKVARAIDTAVYRVVQEALSNVVRHAKASEAVVRLSVQDDVVKCTVSDDGIGFRSSQQRNGSVHGLGLAGIHERVTALNGRCRIESPVNRGTTLQVEIPL